MDLKRFETELVVPCRERVEIDIRHGIENRFVGLKKQDTSIFYYKAIEQFL